jgi:copper chaperone CopZ
MKTKMLSLLVIFFLSSGALLAQTKTSEFEVKGNCGMCKDRIEEAAKSVDGVSRVNWDMETAMLQLSFDASKTSLNEVQMAIAKAGHDTPMHKADDKVYSKLPKCCQYDRSDSEEEMDGHEGQDE